MLNPNKWEHLSHLYKTVHSSSGLKKEENSAEEAPNPFPDFGWEIDPQCLKDKATYYYRTWDGSCNWLRKGSSKAGAQDQAYTRDYTPPHYKPGTLDQPREGPNVRELSNIFFQNRKSTYWDHTPWLLGYVEFLVHDLMWSPASNEKGDTIMLSVPKDDPFFSPKTKLEFRRSERMPGTGENGIPREQINRRSNWMDLETIYGPSQEVNALLRQKDKSGNLKCELILDNDYLPLNDARFNFIMPGRPGQQANLFAGGDLRTNQDFLLIVYQTIFVREHNRMCGVLHEKYPSWDVEQRFQTARVVMGAKMNMIGSAYFKAYFIDVPWPDDPTAIMRSWTGLSDLEINPLTMSYPWKMLLDPKTGNPYGLPNEFSVGYRWHDLIPASLQIVDEKNNPIKLVSLAETAFNATAFMETGINNVVRAMSNTQITDFHSGIQDAYRNMKWNFRDPEEGSGFDLAAWAIMHERERGLPTFNEYIRKVYDGKPPFKARETFEEFTSNVFFQQELKRLYKNPNDVDLWVGQELDEEWWPHTHIPRSMLIINFYTLFKATAADRFGINWGMFWCISNHRPWDCKPTNVLQDLLWKPAPIPLFPNARIPDTFWWEELDLADQGVNLLSRMVMQNTDVKCLQKNLFFVANPKTNPVVCYSLDDMPSPGADRPFYLKPFIKNDDLHFLPFALWGSVQPFSDYYNKYGDVVKFELSTDGTNILLSNPADLDEIFESENWWYRQAMPYSDYTYGRLLGYKDGTGFTALSNSHPSEFFKWKRIRWLVDEHLTSRSGPDYLPLMNRAARKLIGSIQVGQTYAPADDITTYNYELSCSLIYGVDFCDRDPMLMVNVAKVWQDNFFEFLKFSPPYDSVVLWLQGRTKQVNEAMDSAGQFIRQNLNEIRKSPVDKDYWLAKLALTPTSVDGSLLDDNEAMATSFDLFMGFVSLSFPIYHGMYLLCKTPEAMQRAYEEVVSVMGNEGWHDLTPDDLRKMPYMYMVTKEIYRYFPPGGQIYARLNLHTDNLRDWKLPPKTNIMVNTGNIHQDPRFWENPKEFNPDRFDKPIVNNSWIPFGKGKKNCPGDDVSLRATTVFLANLIRSFTWTYEGKDDPPIIRMYLNAGTANPMLFKFQRRV